MTCNPIVGAQHSLNYWKIMIIWKMIINNFFRRLEAYLLLLTTNFQMTSS